MQRQSNETLFSKFGNATIFAIAVTSFTLILRSSTINTSLFWQLSVALFVLAGVGLYFVNQTNTLRTLKNDQAKFRAKLEEETWIKTCQMSLNSKMRNASNLSELAQIVVDTLLETLGAQVGVVYFDNKTPNTKEKKIGLSSNPKTSNLELLAFRGFSPEPVKPSPILLDQIQKVLGGSDIISLTELPDDYFKFATLSGSAKISNTIIIPIRSDSTVIGAIEIGAFRPFTEVQIKLLKLMTGSLGVALNSVLAKQKIKTLLKETQEQGKEIKRASQYKSEFLSNMTHELRTPLNSLLILSQGLARNENNNLTPEQIEDIRIIESGGKDLLALINDILDLSKIEAGVMNYFFEEIDPRNVIQSIEQQFRAVAKEKGIDFTCNVDEDVTSVIKSDHQKIRQILTNFLSNAFKFTENGSIRLLTKKTPNDMIQFLVEDSGIGISEDKFKQIFEAFQQEDGSISRNYGGTGLGLAISKKLATNIGGNISLKSKKGKGSIFSLVVPLIQNGPTEQNTDYNSAPPQLKPASEPNLANNVATLTSATTSPQIRIMKEKKGLIANDNMRDAFALSKALQEAGSKPLLADSDELLIERLDQNNDFDFIVLDSHFSKTENSIITGRLKQIHESKNTPIFTIMDEVTNNDDLEIPDFATSNLSYRPIDTSELIEKISRKLKSEQKKNVA